MPKVILPRIVLPRASEDIQKITGCDLQVSRVSNDDHNIHLFFMTFYFALITRKLIFLPVLEGDIILTKYSGILTVNNKYVMISRQKNKIRVKHFEEV